MFLEALLYARNYARDFTEICHLASQRFYELFISKITGEEIQA